MPVILLAKICAGMFLDRKKTRTGFRTLWWTTLRNSVLRANGLNSKSEFGRIPGARSWFGHDLVMNILQKINCCDNIGLKSLDSAFAIWMTFLEKKTIIFGSSFDVIFEFCALTAQEMPDVDEETQRNIAAVRMLMSLTCVKTGDLHEQNLNRTWSDSWNQIRWGQMFRDRNQLSLRRRGSMDVDEPWARICGILGGSWRNRLNNYS